VVDVFTRRLQLGCEGVAGILSTHDTDGKPLVPYPHQIRAMERVIRSRVNFFLIAHQAGLGKTALIFMIKAAFELKKMSNGVRCGGCKTIISVPPSTISQWEQTALDWLNIPPSQIVATNRSSDVTAEMLSRVRVFIVSRQLISKLYSECYKVVSKRNEQTGQYYSSTERLMTPLHPLFKPENGWDLMVTDEAHFLRNPSTAWCASHAMLAGFCKFCIALSATPLVNRPSDMAGLCTSINAYDEKFNIDFRKCEAWSEDKKLRRVKMDTVRAFHEHTDRVDDDILNLPKIHQEVVSFNIGFTLTDAEEYNALLKKARHLRCVIDQNAKQRDALRDLIGLLQKMQQMLVSPELARMGGEHFQKNPECYKLAAEEAHTLQLGSLQALQDRIVALRSAGHKRIIVASVATAVMKIARHYLGDTAGSLFMYHGGLTLKQRQDEKTNFLTCEEGIMFLSITAGGTGLHLVPGCEAMIFWGTRPFSPAQVWQTLKRIHRIGQTKDVYVHHIVAKGSVDYAIDKAHVDKAGLASAIVDQDFSHLDDGATNVWKKQNRIVDNCHEVETVGPNAGNFKRTPVPSGPLGKRHHRDGLTGAVNPNAGKLRRKLTVVKRCVSPSHRGLIGGFRGFS
jgi:SNF2 family DNA or RNA helicase